MKVVVTERHTYAAAFGDRDTICIHVTSVARKRSRGRRKGGNSQNEAECLRLVWKALKFSVLDEG